MILAACAASCRGRRAFGPDLRGVVGGSPRARCCSTPPRSATSTLARFLLAAGAERPARSTGPRTARGHVDPGRDYVASPNGSSTRERSSSRSSWSGPTARSPSGCKHDADAEPEGHVIGPLAPLRQGADRREQAAEHGEVERRDREPAERARSAARRGGGRAAPSTPAQPSESARCTGAPAASSTSVRCSRGSRTCPERAGALERVAALRRASTAWTGAPTRPRRRARRQAHHATAAHARSDEGSTQVIERRDRDVLAVGRRAVGGVGLALGAVGRGAPEAEGEVGVVAGALPGLATVVRGEGSSCLKRARAAAR